MREIIQVWPTVVFFISGDMIHDTTDLQTFCLLKQENIYISSPWTQISAHLSGQMKMMRIMKYCCQETQITGFKDCSFI